MIVRPTVAEIDLGAIRANCRALRGLLAPGVLHMAVVKADAYGHGDAAVARACLDAGVDRLGVALVEEGVRLRSAGIDAPILVLGEVDVAGAATMVRYRLTATVCGVRAASAVSRAAGSARTPVHVAVDTGMHREGVDVDGLAPLVDEIARMPGLHLEGVWTHLATADEQAHPATDAQLARFRDALDALGGARPPIAHAANSAAAITRPDAHLDMVRTGIAVYGLPPAPWMRDLVVLRPAMRLVSRVASVRRVRAGEGISYGLAYAPSRDTDVACVPIGYADGLSRLLAGSGEVLVRGARRPVAGRISMDQIVVDCGAGGACAGDEVVIIGRQGGEEITADEIAERIGTINYEVVSGVSARVPRVHVA